MIVLAALVIGLFTGWFRATALGGNSKDRIFYAAVFGLIFMLLGILATVLIARMG